MSCLDSLQLRVESLHLPPAIQQYAEGFTDSQGLLTPAGWGVVAGILSGIVCFVLYKGSRLITPLFFKTYRKLSVEDRRNWDTRYSSNLHAACCVYFAYELLYRSDFFWKVDDVPMILRTSNATNLALGISLGYFAVDFVSCVKYNMGGMEMVLHHMGSLAAVATALYTGNGHMHTLWMLMTEFTTPLINNRWWLDKMDMKTNKLYVFNGLAILVCWIFARIMVFPPFFWVVWQTRAQIPLITATAKVLLLAVPVVLTLLNWYWFIKIVKGAMKVLSGPKQKEE